MSESPSGQVDSVDGIRFHDSYPQLLESRMIFFSLKLSGFCIKYKWNVSERQKKIRTERWRCVRLLFTHNQRYANVHYKTFAENTSAATSNIKNTEPNIVTLEQH